MTPFTARIDRATARAIRRFGATSFVWKQGGVVFNGNFGQEREETKDRKKLRACTLEVRKATMTDAPVVGRILTVSGTNVKWEVQSFEHDEVSWTIQLIQPNVPQ